MLYRRRRRGHGGHAREQTAIEGCPGAFAFVSAFLARCTFFLFVLFFFFRNKTRICDSDRLGGFRSFQQEDEDFSSESLGFLDQTSFAPEPEEEFTLDTSAEPNSKQRLDRYDSVKTEREDCYEAITAVNRNSLEFAVVDMPILLPLSRYDDVSDLIPPFDEFLDLDDGSYLRGKQSCLYSATIVFRFRFNYFIF